MKRKRGVEVKDAMGSLLIRAIERSMASGDKGICMARTTAIGERLFITTYIGNEGGEPDFFRAYEVVLMDGDTVRLGEMEQNEFMELAKL